MPKRSFANTASSFAFPPLSRRQFLALSGAVGAAPLLLDPVRTAIRGLISGLIGRARAAPGTQPRNYLFVYLPGGYPRWIFDLVLKTSKNDPKFVPNPHVATCFNGSTPAYDTVTSPAGPVGAYELPSLWNSSIPLSGGGTAPMTALTANLFSLRGVTMLGDGHPGNAYKELQPSPAAPSLNGMVADASNRPIPTVGDMNTGVTAAYHSQLGIGQQLFRDALNPDPYTQLLSPFNSSGDNLPPTYVTRRQAMSQAIAEGLSGLAGYAESGMPGASNLFAMRANAEALMKQGLGNLSASYSEAYNRYLSLITACLTMDRPGVTDSAISPSSLPAGVNDAFIDPTTGTHLMTWATTDKSYLSVGNSDLRTIISGSTALNGLAEGFAVAEYMFTQGYSSAVVCGINSNGGFNFENPVAVNGATGNPAGAQAWGTDEHIGGTAVSLIVNSFTFQALAACLYEFIARMKSAGIWENTVVNLGSEFSRTAKVNASGSDHAWFGNVTTLFSGIIQGPLIVGNTEADTDPAHAGSYGKGAAVPGFEGGIQPSIGNSASTVAALVGIDSPLPNSIPVIAVNNSGGIDPLIGMENV